MIKKHSHDPDVAAAARHARDVVQKVLTDLPEAQWYDYGGHHLRLNEYDMCTRCTGAIAEAQAAAKKLLQKADAVADAVVREHLTQAALLLRLEAEVAVVRAELHNGQASEPILNELLAFIHQRTIHDSYEHSHHPGQ